MAPHGDRAGDRRGAARRTRRRSGSGGVQLMRLHLNENTAGCSPAVLEAHRRGSDDREAGFYPDYDDGAGERRRLSRRARRSPAADQRPRRRDPGRERSPPAATTRSGVPEAIGVAPAFDEYEICMTAPADAWSRCRSTTTSTCRRTRSCAAVTPRTRIVFLTNPHNPERLPDSARHAARSREAASRRRCSSSTRPTPTSPARR